MRFRVILAVLGLVCGLATSALAVQPDEILDDPRLESRAREISTHLRCLVCQNQTIDDSDAPLARDLRLLVRERVKEGDTNEEVIGFVVDRYGEFVLLRPRFAIHNALLWGAPVVLLLIGGLVILVSLRRRGEPAHAELSAEERQALEDVMGRKS